MKNVSLTISEAAKRLKLTGPTVRRYLEEGVIPGAKIGVTWRLDPGALEEFLRGGADGRRASKSETQRER